MTPSAPTPPVLRALLVGAALMLAAAAAAAADTAARAADAPASTAAAEAAPGAAPGSDAAPGVPPVATPAASGAELDAVLGREVQGFVTQSTATLELPGRVEISVGRLDPRLRLAPCDRVEPYLPTGSRLWGRSRIGLRCTQGVSRWNVFLPITVKVIARALVAAQALPAGSVLGPSDLALAEFDLAEEPGSVYDDRQALVGRTLARPVLAGQGLRSTQLRPRQWFAAGEVVRIVANGNGYAVSGSGEALSAGIEGQPVRVRTESGRVVTGQPVGIRQVALSM